MQLYTYAFMIYATSHFSICYPCIRACFDLAILVEIHLSIYCCSHAVFMCVGIVVVCGNVCGCLGCVGEFWWAPGVVGGWKTCSNAAEYVYSRRRTRLRDSRGRLSLVAWAPLKKLANWELKQLPDYDWRITAGRFVVWIQLDVRSDFTAEWRRHYF